MFGALTRRTPQLTSTVRSNIGPPGVQETRPLLSMLNPAGPKSTSIGPGGSPSASDAVTLKVTGTPYVAELGAEPANTAGVSTITVVAVAEVASWPSEAATVTAMTSPLTWLPGG